MTSKSNKKNSSPSKKTQALRRPENHPRPRRRREGDLSQIRRSTRGVQGDLWNERGRLNHG
jgi:hypothetical protein